MRNLKSTIPLLFTLGALAACGSAQNNGFVKLGHQANTAQATVYPFGKDTVVSDGKGNTCLDVSRVASHILQTKSEPMLFTTYDFALGDLTNNTFQPATAVDTDRQTVSSLLQNNAFVSEEFFSEQLATDLATQVYFNGLTQAQCDSISLVGSSAKAPASAYKVVDYAKNYLHVRKTDTTSQDLIFSLLNDGQLLISDIRSLETVPACARATRVSYAVERSYILGSVRDSGPLTMANPLARHLHDFVIKTDTLLNRQSSSVSADGAPVSVPLGVFFMLRDWIQNKKYSPISCSP